MNALGSLAGVTLSLGLLLLSGCHADLGTPSEGSYRGFYLRRSSQDLDQKALQANVKKTGSKELQLSELELSISPSANDILFNFGKTWQNILLSPSSEGCYSAIREKNRVELCLGADRISIGEFFSSDNIQTVYELRKQGEALVPPLETPKSYTWNDLRQAAQIQSFDARMQWEQLEQARAQAANAEQNLLPHLSIGSGLSLISFSPLTLVRLAGELVPFVFPARWYRAEELGEMAVAQEFANQVSSLNRVLSVQTLALQFFQNEDLLQVLLGQLNWVQGVYTDLKKREDAGLYPVGSSDQLELIVKQLQVGVVQTELTRTTLQQSLAQSVGLLNPQGITQLIRPEWNDAQEGKFTEEFTSEEFRELVFARSLELMQMDALIRGAKASATAREWHWLDLSADPNGSLLGFGFSSYLEIGESKVRELEDRKALIQSQLLQQADALLRDVSSAQHIIALQDEALQIAQRRLERIKQQIYVGLPVSLLELTNALQDRIRSELASQAAHYQLIALGLKRDRLLLK